ncbi:MAG: SWIM zinc finger family protein, partial [bacterium]|nr:SWIM zinc finger family protein [bacterium]
WHPKDKTAYKEWAAQQELLEMSEVTRGRGKLEEQYKSVSSQLSTLRRAESSRMAPFYKARQNYFNYLYKRDSDAWFVLDPVITVHPDEIFFECFSRDESGYGRLSCNHDVFDDVKEFACGTTNVDYSSDLYDEFQKIRDYKETRFEIDPSGFEVETEGGESHKEVKIDLPDSWVRGFLQVSAAMTLPGIQVKLHPMDIHNFCFVMRRHKERFGPRSMRFTLSPGKPVSVLFEPWNIRINCARSIYEGEGEHEIRIWGRRRMHILERLIPVAKSFTLHLIGSGMPSFYTVDLGDMTFTLGLSGWTANDWSKAGNFDLMAPRGKVDDFSKRQIFNNLKENWVESTDSLSKRLKVDRQMILSALFSYAQSGLVLYDLPKQRFRVRELSREPLPLSKLRFSSPLEEEAQKFITDSAVKVIKDTMDREGFLHLEGTVKERSRTHKPVLAIDTDEALKRGSCTCDYYFKNKLYKGPCAHMLALRIKYSRQGKRFKLW